MRLLSIACRNFRNLEAVEIEPSPEFNLLWGDNAQGKTNCLEALYLLGNLKSFRGARNDELIGRSGDGCRVSAKAHDNGSEHQIDVTVTATGKSFRRDGKAIQQPEQLLNLLRAILFVPEEIGLIRGYPQARRAFLDRAIFLTRPGYLQEVLQYERTLKQRNRLLREGGKDEQLAPWSESLIRLGACIRLARSRFLDSLRPVFMEAHAAITGDGSNGVALTYSRDEADEARQRDFLSRELAACAARERQVGQTLAGPHRDDLGFEVASRALRVYGSQGQLRTALLAFKAAQVTQLWKTTGRRPLLLLDDLASELDQGRQQRFFGYLEGRRGQVFVTTTVPGPLWKENVGRMATFRVSNGQVRPDAIL